MVYQTIRYEVIEPHIARITLNRPERMNALSRTLFEELGDAVERVEKDDELRAFILTGAPRPDGRPCFSAGADLKARAEGDAIPPSMGLDLANRIDELLKPSIAVADGICTTGAMEVFLACDLRIAAETAQFSDWHLKRLGAGLGAWGASTRLTRLVGLQKAKEMILTGMVVDGIEAHRIGLVNRVYPSEKAMEGAIEMARSIAAMRPEGVRVTLAFLDTSMDMQKHQSLRWAQLVRNVTGIDSQTGQAAKDFVQKRTTEPGA